MNELTRIALAGLSRAPAAAQPDRQHPAESLLGSKDHADAEHSFLLRAGARAAYERCGVASRIDVTPIDPAPPEDRSFASPKIAGFILNALAVKSTEALSEFCNELEARNLLLPREVIPDALNVSEPELRARLLPLLGRRGEWLSRYREAWRWVTEDVALLNEEDMQSLWATWNEGKIAHRCRALTAVRRNDPGEGRKWLVAAIDQEKPEHRAALVTACSAGLSAEDEAWLEARLGDRSEVVRAAAADLLVRLPESALSRRMRERAAAMLNVRTDESGRVIGLVCSPPEEIDKAWQRDGISSKTPPGRGKRAVWLESVLSCVPTSTWTIHFGADAARWIEMGRGDDFVIPLLSGWTMAAVRFAESDPQSAAWLQPLWEEWTNLTGKVGNEMIRLPIDPLQEILRAMRPAEAEAALLARLKSEGLQASSRTMSLLTLLPRPWSEVFARTYLALARRVVAQTAASGEYRWATSLSTAARAIPGVCFSAALEEWTFTKDISAAGLFRREVDRFLETIEARNMFSQLAIPEES